MSKVQSVLAGENVPKIHCVDYCSKAEGHAEHPAGNAYHTETSVTEMMQKLETTPRVGAHTASQQMARCLQTYEVEAQGAGNL